MEYHNIQLDEMLKDLKAIKTTIKKNAGLMKKLVYKPSVIVIAFVYGFLFIVISLIYRYFIISYSSYHSIPEGIKLILFSIIILLSLATLFFKITVFIKTKKDQPEISYLDYYRKLAGNHFLITAPFLVICCVYFSFYFALLNVPQYIIPAISLFAGLICVFYGAVLLIGSFLVFGYWLCLSALVSIPFLAVKGPDNLIWIGATFGIGFILLGFMIAISIKKVMKE